MSQPLGSGSQLPWDGIPAYIRGPQSTILENNPFIGSNLMRVILIGVDNSWWDLAGAYAGRQYLTLSNHASGFMFPPFKTLFTEGPYQVGAYPERTDFLKRTMNLGIDVGIDYLGGPSSMQYRMLEQRFWRALSPTEDAWLLCFTKTHGWRILKIRLSEEPKTPMEFDPTTYENNYMRWDIVVVACNPYYAKRTVLDSWVNPEATATPWDEIQYQIQNTINKFLGDVLAGGGGTLVPGKDVGSGHVTAWNNSDYTQWPKFLVSSPGRCWIEDGPGTGRMIPMPLTTPDRGTFMVDTDPNAQTISEENDPVDPWFYQIARNSQFLDVVLGNLTTQTEPLWKQFNGRFQIPAPKRSRCTYKVYHSENGGTVQLLMPQTFNMAYG